MSATVTVMQLAHRMTRVWHNSVDVFIATSNAARLLLIEGGLPPSRIVVKPNFVFPDPGQGTHSGQFAIFLGRLSPEKGVSTLLEAWESHDPGIPLLIAGDGPLAARVQAIASRNPAINWLGFVPAQHALELIRDASLLVFPSEWEEPFGRVIIEAFACGTPVVASAIGASTELVTPDKTGILFEPGNAEQFSRSVAQLMRDPAPRHRLGRGARAEFETRYTAESNYVQLMSAYRFAMERAQHGGADD